VTRSENIHQQIKPQDVLQATERTVPITRPTVAYSFSCQEHFCRNGGLCYYEKGFKCICPRGWTGLVCDRMDFDAQGERVAQMIDSTEAPPTGGRGWVTAVVVVVVIVVLVAVALILVLRTRSQLRPGEVFRIVRLKATLLRNKESDGKLEALINPTGCDMLDNIYTDVNDINEQGTRNKPSSVSPNIAHSQSLDSVHSACSFDKKQNKNLF